MNILGVGPAELVVILIIALIFAGPKRMIRWAYIMGTWFAKFRVIWSDLMSIVQKEINAAGLDIEVPKDIPSRQSINQMAQKALKPLSDPMQETVDELRKTQSQINEAGKQVNVEVGGAWADVNKTVKGDTDTVQSDTISPEKPAIEQDGKRPSVNGQSGFGTWANPAKPKDESTT